MILNTKNKELLDLLHEIAEKEKVSVFQVMQRLILEKLEELSLEEVVIYDVKDILNSPGFEKVTDE